MGFRVGEKVVCIDDRVCIRLHPRWWTFRRSYLLGHNLNRGEVYTVTNIYEAPDLNGNSIQLLIVDGAKHFKKPNVGFPAEKFRPLTERSTDAGMSILRKILTDAEKEMV